MTDEWISHEATPDSVCPIPPRVTYEVKFKDGTVHKRYHGDLDLAWAPCGESTIVAYRIIK